MQPFITRSVSGGHYSSQYTLPDHSRQDVTIEKIGAYISRSESKHTCDDIEIRNNLAKGTIDGYILYPPEFGVTRAVPVIAGQEKSRYSIHYAGFAADHLNERRDRKLKSGLTGLYKHGEFQKSKIKQGKSHRKDPGPYKQLSETGTGTAEWLTHEDIRPTVSDIRFNGGQYKCVYPDYSPQYAPSAPPPRTYQTPYSSGQYSGGQYDDDYNHSATDSYSVPLRPTEQAYFTPPPPLSAPQSESETPTEAGQYYQ